MPSSRAAAVLAATWMLAVCGGGADTRQSPSPTAPSAGWSLIWSDEFDAPDGARPDPARWAYDLGGGGWSNLELQTYTDRVENAMVRGGALVITARAERFTGGDGISRDFTSARLTTSSFACARASSAAVSG